jgi:hypothetical protein
MELLGLDEQRIRIGAVKAALPIAVIASLRFMTRISLVLESAAGKPPAMESSRPGSWENLERNRSTGDSTPAGKNDHVNCI